MGMVLLMVIGGSPGSTAGGMKTTTRSGSVCHGDFRISKKNEQAHLYNRRIAEETQRNAATILFYI